MRPTLPSGYDRHFTFRASGGMLKSALVLLASYGYRLPSQASLDGDQIASNRVPVLSGRVIGTTAGFKVPAINNTYSVRLLYTTDRSYGDSRRPHFELPTDMAAFIEHISQTNALELPYQPQLKKGDVYRESRGGIHKVVGFRSEDNVPQYILQDVTTGATRLGEAALIDKRINVSSVGDRATTTWTGAMHAALNRPLTSNDLTGEQIQALGWGHRNHMRNSINKHLRNTRIFPTQYQVGDAIPLDLVIERAMAR